MRSKQKYRVTARKIATPDYDPSRLIADIPIGTVETMAVSEAKAINNACFRLGIGSRYWSDEYYGEVWSYKFDVTLA